MYNLACKLLLNQSYIILQDRKAKLISQMRRPQTTIKNHGWPCVQTKWGYAAKTQHTQYCSNLKLYIGSDQWDLPIYMNKGETKSHKKITVI